VRSFRADDDVELTGVGYAMGAAALFGASTPAAKASASRSVCADAVGSPLFGSRDCVIRVPISGICVSRSSNHSWRSPSNLRRHFLWWNRRADPDVPRSPALLSALTGSLLLNLEGLFTALIAVGLMREHLGRREMFAAATIMMGGVLVSFSRVTLAAIRSERWNPRGLS
jgi:hypothetical protein